MIAKALLLAASFQAPLNVMTYNIRYDNPSDGPDAWPQRREAIITWLRAEAPDVLALQEALRGQLDDLAPLGYREIGVGRVDGVTRGEYAAILYRPERLEALEHATFWFSDTPDVPGSRSWGNTVTRICTWARFRDRASGWTFYVYNVHLDHQSQPSRERSAAALLAAIAGRRHAGDDVIVTGDFNAPPDNPAVRAMAARLRDTWAAFAPGDTTRQGTFNGFRLDQDGERIDYIFASEALRGTNARILRPLTPAGRQLSDHYAVRATLVRAAETLPRP